MAVKYRQRRQPETASESAIKGESRIIIFTSAKGGSGCSFMANSVSEYMAQKTVSNVLLLDMNMGRMDSRIIFGIDDPGARDFGDLALCSGEPDTGFLKNLVINLESSLNLILPPLQANRPPITGNGLLGPFIEVLRDHFDIICMDMPGYLLQFVDMEEIDISDRFVLVSLPDQLSANNSRIFLDQIRRSRPFSDLYLVINKYNLKPAVSSTGLSNILRHPVSSFIPYDRDIEELVNTRGPGRIFSYSLSISRNISGLAGKIYEELDL